MYRTVVVVQEGAYDSSRSRIFIPELATCNIHSVHFDISGATGVYESIDYEIVPPFLVLSNGVDALLSERSEFVVRIDYHDLRPADSLSEVSMAIVRATIQGEPSVQETTVLEQRAKIFGKHFSHGQFSLDMGLYKEAVLNYGTVLETMLNTELEFARMSVLINESHSTPTDKELMNQINALRNRVHPERLLNFDDVNRSDAITVRHNIDLLINKTGVVNQLS